MSSSLVVGTVRDLFPFPAPPHPRVWVHCARVDCMDTMRHKLRRSIFVADQQDLKEKQ